MTSFAFILINAWVHFGDNASKAVKKQHSMPLEFLLFKKRDAKPLCLTLYGAATSLILWHFAHGEQQLLEIKGKRGGEYLMTLLSASRVDNLLATPPYFVFL